MKKILIEMQKQITSLEAKIDILIARSAPRPVEAKPSPKPFPPQANNYRERVLHKAICADCKKECEVPFKPSGERPVYCKECFGKRKTGSSFRDRPDNRPREAAPVQETHTDRPHGNEKKRFAGKKKLSKSRKRSK